MWLKKDSNKKLLKFRLNFVKISWECYETFLPSIHMLELINKNFSYKGQSKGNEIETN